MGNKKICEFVYSIKKVWYDSGRNGDEEMFIKEQNKYLKTIYNSNKKIDEEMINIKVAIHNLEKLGLNTENLNKMLDDTNIEFYKFKTFIDKLIKVWQN